MRATTDRARLDAAIDAAKVDADATRYGPALKLAESILSRSQARRTGGRPHQRLPARRLDRLRGRALPRGLHADARVGRVAQVEQHRHPVDHLRARVVLGPGAHHGHRRHRQQGQRAGVRRAGDARDRRPPDPDAAGEDRRQRDGVRLVHASSRVDRPIVKGTVRAGTDPLPADNVFHFTVSPERAGVAAGRDQPGQPRFSALPVAGARHRHDSRRSGPTSCRSTRVTPANFEKRVGRDPERRRRSRRPAPAAR